MRFPALLSVVLSGALVAQQTSGPQSALLQQTGDLKVIVLQGDGAINSIKAKSATQPVVEVRDESDKPVPGAEVIFQLPAAGAGGVFHGWMRTQTAKTNEQGQAAALGMTPNEDEGRFNIKVTATLGKKTGSAVVAQSNSRTGGEPARVSRGNGNLWKVLVVIGAAALVGGIVAATRGGDSVAATPTNPVIITPGPVSVGGPR